MVLILRRPLSANAITAYGKNWQLVTNDYVWGHNTAKATKALVEKAGGNIMGEILVPQGTRDFSSILLKIQQTKPQVVAAAVGGDDQKAMRQQVAQLGMGQSPAWINNQQDWPDVYGLPTIICSVYLVLPGTTTWICRV